MQLLQFFRRMQGSPRAVVEAMACGCAILTTRNSGTPVVSGGRVGFFPAVHRKL